MYLSDAVRDRIRYYQNQTGMSLWGLFKASGVPMSTLAAFMSKRTELIKLDTLLHICEGFGITITEFFENDVFKDVEQDYKKNCQIKLSDSFCTLWTGSVLFIIILEL